MDEDKIKSLIPDPNDLVKIINYVKEQRDWDNISPEDARAMRIRHSLAALMYITVEIDRAKSKGYL